MSSAETKKEKEEEEKPKEKEEIVNNIIDEVKDIIDEIRWVGKTKKDEFDDACDACIQQEKKLEEIVKNNPNVKVEHFDPDTTDYGKKVMKKVREKVIPHTEICQVNRKTKEKIKCETIVGYNEEVLNKRYLEKKEQ